MSVRVETFGSVSRTRSDGAGCCGPNGDEITSPFDVCVNPTAAIEVDRGIVSPTDWVNLLTATGLTSVSFAKLTVQNGTLSARISSALAADQIVPLGDLYLYVGKSAGQALTALAVRGQGRIFGLLAGD